MNKTELAVEIAKKMKASKSEAMKFLDAYVDTIEKTLKKGKDVAITGFGTFKVSKRKARMGRNPATGKAIKIAAKTVPAFKAGLGLKKAVK